MYSPDPKDDSEEAVCFKDVVMTYLAGGMDSLLSLYTDTPIPPSVSQEAWDFLRINDRTEERLALALWYMHAPVEHAGRVLPLGSARLYKH